MSNNRFSNSALFRAGIILCVAVFWVPVCGGVQKEKSDRKDLKDNGADQAIRLHSDLVVLNVTVTDARGRYATGLGAKDFYIFEDGQPQSVSSISTEEAPFAAAILIDMSGSMEYKFGMVRGAAASFLEHITGDDQVAVYGFNIKIRQFQDFSNAKDISDYIWDAKAERETRLYDCMQEGIEALAKRPEKRRAELIISDGWDNFSKATRDSVVKRAVNETVSMYTIDLTDDELLNGTGEGPNGLRRGRMELQEIARQSGGRYVHSPKGDQIEEAFTGVVEELRNQYTLTYYSTNPKRDGRWRKLEVRVVQPGLSARTKSGYNAPKQ
jgi:Ca-activated chloride channel family protein